MITVAIPTYNCSLTLRYTMERLTHQKMPNLKVICYDQGSFDGTCGLLGDWQSRGFWQKKAQEKNALDFHYFHGSQDMTLHPWQRALEARQAIAKLCKSPFIFFLDPDVLIRQMVLPRLLEELKENEKCAFIGMKYEPDTQDHDFLTDQRHIMAGATLWHTDLFLKIPKMTAEDLKQCGCDCNFVRKYIEKLGYFGLHYKTQAEHLKGVFI